MTQFEDFNPHLSIHTHASQGEDWIKSAAWVEVIGRRPFLKIEVRAACARGGDLVASLRPVNPEGISLTNTIRLDRRLSSWIVNDNAGVRLSPFPARVAFSDYRRGMCSID